MSDRTAVLVVLEIDVRAHASLLTEFNDGTIEWSLFNDHLDIAARIAVLEALGTGRGFVTRPVARLTDPPQRVT